jgi:branched-chain amino acid aminotransferase
MSLTWFDGQLHAGPIEISAHDRGLTLGDGIFETILVKERKLIWRDDHLKRMAESAHTIGLPFPAKDIDEALSTLTEQGEDHHVLRLTLTRGVAARGLAGEGKKPTLVATLDSFDEGLMFKPARLITSNIRRNETSPLSRIKSLSYGDNIMAAREATMAHVDDALMLNSKGHVTCATIGNIFAVIRGELATPPLADGVLPGITRQKLLKGAVEMSLTLSDLQNAEAVFLTNSLRLLRPITELDGKALKHIDLAPFEKALLAAL